jgi:hypothetical protein
MRSVGVPRDCTDADGLAKYGLLVNTRAKIIICSACEYAVGANHLAAHMRAHHKLTKLEEDFGRQLVEKYGVKNEPFLPPVRDDGSLERAIGGLPIHSGFRCTMCAYFCKERASMLEHIRRCHKEDQAGSRREDMEGASAPLMAACRVQTIFTGLFRRYFGVLDDDDGDNDGQVERSVAVSLLWPILERKIDEQKKEQLAAQADSGPPDNPRLRDPFHLSMRWDKVVRREHSEDDHVRFAALPRSDEGTGLGMLPKMALGYIHLVSEEVSGGHVLLRQKVLALSKYVCCCCCSDDNAMCDVVCNLGISGRLKCSHRCRKNRPIGRMQTPSLDFSAWFCAA